MKLVVSVNVLPNYIEKLTANCLRSGGLYDKTAPHSTLSPQM